MNAALIAACATNGANVARKNTQPVYIIPTEHRYKKVERPIAGMIKMLNARDMAILDAYPNDGVEVRFYNVHAVDALIRDLQDLKENMIALGGED